MADVVPVRVTVGEPTGVLTWIDDDHVPVWVGARRTVTVTEAPAANWAPAAGAPLMENGAAGPVTDVTVNGDPPVLVIENVFVGDAPMATSPKAAPSVSPPPAPEAGRYRRRSPRRR